MFLARTLVALLAKSDVRGLESFPKDGPALIVVNHLGDADTALLLAALPAAPDALGKIELRGFPLLGILMQWYGTIWLQRGRPDRLALQSALQALAQGRFVVIAPEGRYTHSGALEKGRTGAAWLAQKANVPIVPIALTGTQNQRFYGSLRRLRRPRISLTVGAPFRLQTSSERSWALRTATHQIMDSLARLLPPEYRGVYASPPPA